jgi:hypothetical protein
MVEMHLKRINRIYIAARTRSMLNSRQQQQQLQPVATQTRVTNERRERGKKPWRKSLRGRFLGRLPSASA